MRITEVNIIPMVDVMAHKIDPCLNSSELPIDAMGVLVSLDYGAESDNYGTYYFYIKNMQCNGIKESTGKFVLHHRNIESDSEIRRSAWKKSAFNASQSLLASIIETLKTLGADSDSIVDSTNKLTILSGIAAAYYVMSVYGFGTLLSRTNNDPHSIRKLGFNPKTYQYTWYNTMDATEFTAVIKCAVIVKCDMVLPSDADPNKYSAYNFLMPVPK